MLTLEAGPLESGVRFAHGGSLHRHPYFPSGEIDNALEWVGMNEGSHLLTLNQAAEKLGVSRSTVQRRVADGSIVATKLGTGRSSPVRIPEGEIERWLWADPDEAGADASFRPRPGRSAERGDLAN